MSTFFSSLTDKAQAALNSSGLAQRLPSGLTGQPTSGENAQGGDASTVKSHAFEHIHHQLRTFQQQYSSSTTPVQKIITAAKGVAIDFDSVSRDSHAHSKDLYLWGQNEDQDIKDVTDRLAWVNYIEGSLANNLATKLDAARSPFKTLRDAENTLNARLNIRNGLTNQIGRLEHEQSAKAETRLAELRKQLQIAEFDDEPLEKEVAVLKRKAIIDSEQVKWTAVQEYAEKLLLLSQASNALLTVLSVVPPAEKAPYSGTDTTASIRAALQEALDNYNIGDTTLRLSPGGDLSRSDTRSFGETHASELSSIGSAGLNAKPGIPITPPRESSPPRAPSHNADPAAQSVRSNPSVLSYTPPQVRASPPPHPSQSPPLNPATLNLAPAPIPIPTNAPSAVVEPDPFNPTVKIPSVTPTVAETGVPQTSADPGPASGSLRDLKSPTNRSPVTTRGPLSQQVHGPGDLPGYGGSDVANAPSSARYESAEDEKKRLEREERERILASGRSEDTDGSGPPPSQEEQLPSYQEF